jgi:Protein of Unknown function (DUF2784)
MRGRFAVLHLKRMAKMKRYQWYADGIVAVHFAWTVVVFGGAALMFFWPPYALPEIIVVSITLLVSLPFGGLCPLTMMEEYFRRRIDPSFRNDGSYMTYYINKLMGTRFRVRTVNKSIGIFYTLVYGAAVFLLAGR